MMIRNNCLKIRGGGDIGLSALCSDLTSSVRKGGAFYA